MKFVHENVDKFGIAQDKIFIAGESGGGNLSLATAMRLKRSGNIHLVRRMCRFCGFLVLRTPRRTNWWFVEEFVVRRSDDDDDDVTWYFSLRYLLFYRGTRSQSPKISSAACVFIQR